MISMGFEPTEGAMTAFLYKLPELKLQLRLDYLAGVFPQQFAHLWFHRIRLGNGTTGQ